MTREAGGSLLALLVPGGLVLLGGIMLTLAALAGTLYAATGTGDPRLEALRWRVAWKLARQLGASVRPAHARAMMAILRNELPVGWKPGVPVVGDETFAGGPSIGPGQVYRRTAKDLGLWKPAPGMTEEAERAAYRSLASDEDLVLTWAVAVFRSKLAAARGDVTEAVRRYNGSGPEAEKYRDRAVVWAAERWGVGGFGA